MEPMISGVAAACLLAVSACDLLWRGRGDVDLEEHSWPDEGTHDDDSAGRLDRAGERLGLVFACLGEIANVGHVGDDLVDILDRRVVLCQKPLDLVPGIAALRTEVAVVPDDSALGAVFVFRSDAAQIDDLSRVPYRDDFGKTPLRSFGVVVALLLKGRIAGLGLGHRRHAQDSDGEHRHDGRSDGLHCESSNGPGIRRGYQTRQDYRRQL